jgi:Protein of unknown function (DUF2800)
MTDQHAEYAPSSMYLTVACPGWHKQASLLPPEAPTEATKEGDAGHEVAAFAASNRGWEHVLAVGDATRNRVGITEEMLDGAALWVEALEGFPARIETPVQIKRIHPTKCWGTPDARQWAPETKTLRAADYKFGHGFVDEFENWQMLAYMVGMCDELGVFNDPGVKLEMTVVQPRYYNGKPIRTWTIGTQGLWHYAERMRHAVAEAESANPRVMSGTHCTYCPARGVCDTYRKTIGNAIDFAGRADPMVSTPEDVGRELKVVQDFIQRLEARETGLAALAEAMIRQGKRVPHFAFEQTVGRLAWTADVELIEFTARMSGKSIMAAPKPITPAQAIQRKILADKVVNEYAARSSGAFKLVPEPTKIRSFQT